MINLGKLKEIKDLRKVWPHEALDFTPWLAEEDKGIYQIETKSDLIVFLSAETCGLEEGTYAVIESHAFDAGATAKRLSLYGQMFTVLCRGNIKMLVKES